MAGSSGISDNMRIVETLSNISVELRNIREACNRLGIPYHRLARIINHAMEQGVLYEYYNTGLHRIKQVEFYIVTMSQKTLPKLCLNTLGPSIVYYSFTSRPLFLVYVFNKSIGEGLVLDGFRKRVCKTLLQGTVKNVLVPLKKNGFLELVEFDSLVEGNSVIDPVDEAILYTIFRQYNPATKSLKTRELYEYTGLGISYPSFLNHYYRHVRNKLIRKRLVFKQSGSYAIMIVSGPNIPVLRDLLTELLNLKILTSIDQVNLLESSPTIAVVHAWVNPFNLYSTHIYHEIYNFTSYEIFLVQA
ncbi:hypothetical protein ACSU1N_01480 [Thermogladius sp. 4427co]|uniref:hypothetical protein n=1 Tax=Thermogladius sp. 4427co TaxID=3450718 RepID=UPI003F7A723C